MFQIWQSVQVKNPAHPRGNKSGDPQLEANGDAGVVFSTDPANPNEVAVRFDLDQRVELVQVADLRTL